MTSRRTSPKQKKGKAVSVEQKATNIIWHKSEVALDEREVRNRHKGAVLWFTGFSGSGKSTLAQAVQTALFRRGCHTYVLDGDNVRHRLNKDLGFSPADREENIRRVGEVASLFRDAGTLTLTAFISPYRVDREQARAITGDGFIEIYVECDIAICEERDPKGLYKKARAGEIPDFTGISAPYEVPENPELIINTGKKDLDACVAEVIAYLEKESILAI